MHLKQYELLWRGCDVTKRRRAANRRKQQKSTSYKTATDIFSFYAEIPGMKDPFSSGSIRKKGWTPFLLLADPDFPPTSGKKKPAPDDDAVVIIYLFRFYFLELYFCFLVLVSRFCLRGSHFFCLLRFSFFTQKGLRLLVIFFQNWKTQHMTIFVWLSDLIPRHLGMFEKSSGLLEIGAELK